MSETPPLPDLWAIDLDQVESAVLRRLIAEVQWDLAEDGPAHGVPRAYDRVHNRHNRGNGVPRPYPPAPPPPPPEPPAPAEEDTP
jgi:hypothetical protein